MLLILIFQSLSSTENISMDGWLQNYWTSSPLSVAGYGTGKQHCILLHSYSFNVSPVTVLFFIFLSMWKDNLCNSKKSLVKLSFDDPIHFFSFRMTELICKWREHDCHPHLFGILWQHKNIFLTQHDFEQEGTLFGRRDNHIDWAKPQA
jgi:hypothetical protein